MGVMVVIQCATPPEFEALHAAFGRPELAKAGKRLFFHVDKQDCVVLRGAVGKVWAAASAEFAIGRWSPRLMIDFGAAGALRDGLRVGDLVIAEKVIEHDVADAEGGLPWAPAALGATFVAIRGMFATEAWIEAVPVHPEFLETAAGPRATRGRIAAGDKDVQTRDERAVLADAANAIAVTWESSAIGRVCKFHDVAYLSIRVITDVGGDEFLAEYKAGVARALMPAARAVAGLLKRVTNPKQT